MRVKDLMTLDPVTVPSELTVSEAEQLAQNRGIRHLLVTHEDQLAGVLCLCDLRDHDPRASVSQIMSAPFVAVDENAPVEQAATTMHDLAIGCLPVLSGRTLTGILTRGDLWRAGLARIDLGGRLCASCRTHMHVRPDARTPEDVSFCVECLARSRPVAADDDEDFGVSD